MDDSRTKDFFNWILQERNNYLLRNGKIMSRNTLVDELLEILHIVDSGDEKTNLLHFVDLIERERLLIYRAGIQDGIQLEKAIHQLI